MDEEVYLLGLILVTLLGIFFQLWRIHSRLVWPYANPELLKNLRYIQHDLRDLKGLAPREEEGEDAGVRNTQD